MPAEGPSRRVERCLQRVEEHPESAAAHYNLGLAYTQRGRAARAEPHYRKALELEPDLVEAWVNLGGVLLLKWDFRGALAANEEALRRKDDLLLAHYNIGQASLYLGNVDGVVRANRRVVELDPEHAAGRYFLAVGLLAAGQVAEAREEAGRAKGLGYSPAPDFLRALEASETRLVQPSLPDSESQARHVSADDSETDTQKEKRDA